VQGELGPVLGAVGQRVGVGEAEPGRAGGVGRVRLGRGLGVEGELAVQAPPGLGRRPAGQPPALTLAEVQGRLRLAAFLREGADAVCVFGVGQGQQGGVDVGGAAVG